MPIAWKKLGRLGLAGVAIGLIAGPPAAQAEMTLDRSFGVAGRVTTPAQVLPQVGTTPVALAETDRGKLVAAIDTTIVRYLPSGRIDRSFGASGRVTIQAAPGSRFALTNISIDSRSRIVAVGTSESDIANVAYWLRPTAVRIVRYLPNGALDPAFGGGDGVLDTDLGLPTVQGLQPGVAPVSVVYATGMAVDGEDRVVITGGQVAREGQSCVKSYFNPMPHYASFVARLTQQGDLDRSFGAGRGILVDDPTGSPGPLPTFGASEPRVDGQGRIDFIAGRSGQGENFPTCEAGEPSGLVRLTPNGAPDEGFGAGGFAELDSLGAYALGGKGRVFATVGTATPQGVSREELIRLTPTGAVDRRFGSSGGVPLVMPESRRTGFGLLALGKNGETIVAGTREERNQVRHPLQKWFALCRVGGDGRLDRSVGRRGLLSTRFGRRSFAFARALILDRQGRPVIAGVYRGGLALARYAIDR